jgi:hypothetical protein
MNNEQTIDKELDQDVSKKNDREEKIENLLLHFHFHQFPKPGLTGVLSVLCPAHYQEWYKHEPSLMIDISENEIFLRCYKGCSTEKILDALGMKKEDLIFNKEHEP